MTVTSTAMALGNWSIKLRNDVPRSVLDAITYFGHIAISTGRPDPRVSLDSLLTSARYVGVLRGKTEQAEGWSLSGSGMAFWIGDENDKGPILTTQLLLTSSTFTNAINQCLAAGNAVIAGNLHSVTGSYSGVHQWQTTRKAISYICATMTSDYTNPVEWRVNGDATLDAGYVSDLYITSPVAAIIRRHVGADMAVRALPGKAVTTGDVTDFTTRVVLLAQGGGQQVSSGVANIAPGLNPYKDARGNPVAITRTSSESSTNPANAPARAAIVLSQYQTPRQAVQLSTSQFDIDGDLSVGDWVWVHDPDAGLVDTANELVFRGERINPMKLRVKEMSWPVVKGMSVAYRDNNGVWVDLTDYVVWESGDSHVVVGGYDRSLINPTGVAENLGSRAMPNTTIPAVPAFTLPWDQAVYQSANSGITKAQVKVAWSQPANSDGSAIIDGDHYEIRYRPSSTPVYPATWAQVAGLTWSQMSTWSQPITYQTGPWQIAYVRWDTTTFLIQELTPGIPYEMQIRAVDNGLPPNFSAWSASNVIQTAADTIPPSPPAAPSVAASRIAVQITHSLGKSSGGTFNLEPDLHHLEIHAQYEPLFTPSPSTLLGKLICNNGMMLAQIPAVGTFPVESVNPLYFKVIAVDEAGNKSGPSTAAQSTAKLIDDAHISDLTVSKLTAGTIKADVVVGARIKTADVGARVELSPSGLLAYDVNNTQTVNVDSNTGNVTVVGKVQTGDSGQPYRVALDPSYTPPGGFVGTNATLAFYTQGSPAPATVTGIRTTGPTQLALTSGPSAAGNSYNQGQVLVASDRVQATFANQSGFGDGGWWYLDATHAQFAQSKSGVGSVSTYRIDINGNHYTQGIMSAGFAFTDFAFAAGNINVTSPAGSATWGYGATIPGTVCAVADFANYSGAYDAGINVQQYGPTSTGTNVGWGKAATGRFSIWVYRQA